jgi:hypothetical protein
VTRDVQHWSPERHVAHACELAEQAESDGGSYGQVLALIGQLHVQIAFAKSELREER